MIKKAIIGGTGVYSLDEVQSAKDIETPYGAVTVYIQSIGDERIAFLPRHGKGHSIPPHKINYRGNIRALKQLGVEKILATAAVGSLNEKYPPGSLIIPDQFIDFTRQRVSTFHDGEDGVAHADMAVPYCPRLIKAIEERAAKAGTDISGRGTYICVEGPRFETKAEIEFFRQIGGDMVGMTGVPEVVLARELNMCYAAVGIVTNWGNGMTKELVSHKEITGIMKRGRNNVITLFLDIFSACDYPGECSCKEGTIRL